MHSRTRTSFANSMSLNRVGFRAAAAISFRRGKYENVFQTQKKSHETTELTLGTTWSPLLMLGVPRRAAKHVGGEEGWRRTEAKNTAKCEPRHREVLSPTAE